MHRLFYGLALCLLTGPALAQTGGSSSGGGASTGGAASPGAAAPSAAPSATPSATAPGAATSPPSSTTPLNTQVLPPSRSLPTSAPSASSSGQPLPGSPAGTPAAGTPAAPDPNLPATASGGRPQPGGANSSAQSTRTGKNAISESYADCVRLWDNQTHMSKAEWLRTCRRTENRLQNLKVENKDVDVSGPKPRRAGKSPESSAAVQAQEVAPPRSPGR
jgi:hypothetical protein